MIKKDINNIEKKYKHKGPGKDRKKICPECKYKSFNRKSICIECGYIYFYNKIVQNKILNENISKKKLNEDISKKKLIADILKKKFKKNKNNCQKYINLIENNKKKFICKNLEEYFKNLKV